MAMERGTALGEFVYWLPFELEYSATKAPYEKKLERAKLPIDNHRSIYGFLGNEWDHFQLQHRSGVNYVPHHGKSAQLQLAKFAAGLFDKAVIPLWLDTPIDRAPSPAKDIKDLVESVFVRDDWHRTAAVAPDLSTPFDQTVFGHEIPRLMNHLAAIADNAPNVHEDGLYYQVLTRAIRLGNTATAGYVAFAEEYLTPEQYVLPMSELESD